MHWPLLQLFPKSHVPQCSVAPQLSERSPQATLCAAQVVGVQGSGPQIWPLPGLETAPLQQSVPGAHGRPSEVQQAPRSPQTPLQQ